MTGFFQRTPSCSRQRYIVFLSAPPLNLGRVSVWNRTLVVNFKHGLFLNQFFQFSAGSVWLGPVSSPDHSANSVQVWPGFTRTQRVDGVEDPLAVLGFGHPFLARWARFLLSYLGASTLDANTRCFSWAAVRAQVRSGNLAVRLLRLRVRLRWTERVAAKSFYSSRDLRWKLRSWTWTCPRFRARVCRMWPLWFGSTKLITF